ncbi:MAG: hypothetical protein JWN40_4060 [Phycisphaerales bacterium]|nr:hypothetical protein [Phycisphaerales bacterium]
MHPVRALVVSASLAFLPAGQFVLADVIVHQVESRPAENPTTGYAPIDFAGSTIQPGTGNFVGITFNALANTTNTFSPHAATVGGNYYGVGTVAHPFVNSAYIDEVDNFLNNVVKTQTISSSSAPAPGRVAPVGVNVRVSNHSYIASYPTLASDQDAVRRMDYLINRDQLVFVAAAATSVVGSTQPNAYLPWSARNSLAVRGDDSVLLFNPGLTPPGKTHADLWGTGLNGDNTGSYVTGAVSGYAAALIGQSQLLGPTFSPAGHEQVVRSLLMTGADKTAVSANNGAWSNQTANHLSVGLGAGKVRYNTSLDILNAGPRAIASVAASSIGSATASATTKGWAYGTSVNGDQAIVVYAPNGIDDVTATLNWNVTQPDVGSNINSLPTATIFPDLNLELRPVTPNGGGFTVGAAIADPGLQSASTGANSDNIEHLYSTNDLPGGYYAFIIHGDASKTVPYGFSYNITPVPEPTGLVLLVLGAAPLLRRRRRA